MPSNCGLWCWRRLLRAPWTTKRSNQSILRKTNPEYSLERLTLTLKLQYFGHLIQTTTSLEKSLMVGKIMSRRRREWDGLMASLIQWTWTRAYFGRWWGWGGLVCFSPSVTKSRTQLGNWTIICSAMDTGVYISLKVRVFSSYMPWNGVAGSCGNTIFDFFKENPYCFIDPYVFLCRDYAVLISLERLKTEGEEGDRGWDGWIASHRFNGHKLGQTLGDGKGQGSLVCCSSWGSKSRTCLDKWITTEV